MNQVEVMKLKNKWIDWVIFFFIMFLIGFLIWLAFYVIENKEAYMDNPYLYGATHMTGGGEVECRCTHYKPTGKNVQFEFNNTYWGSTMGLGIRDFYDDEEK